MCDPVTIGLLTSAAIGAGGAGISYVNTRNTNRRQDAAAAQGIRQQAETQRQVNARLNRTLDQSAASKPDEVRNRTADQYLRAINAKRMQATAGLRPQGVSSAFDEAATAASAQVPAYATDIGGLMATIDSGDLQRQGEQFNYGNLGMDLDVLGNRSQGDAFLNRLRVGGIQRNPWLDATAAALAGYGSSRAGRSAAPTSPYGPYAGGYNYPRG